MDISNIQDPNELLELYKQKVESIVIDFEGNLVEQDEKGNPVIAEKVSIQKKLSI